MADTNETARHFLGQRVVEGAQLDRLVSAAIRFVEPANPNRNLEGLLLPTEFEKNLAYRFEFKEALKEALDVHDAITRVIMLSKLEERYSQGMNQLDAVIDISKKEGVPVKDLNTSINHGKFFQTLLLQGGPGDLGPAFGCSS